MKLIYAVLLWSLIGSHAAIGQDDNPTRKTSFSLEVDPATFFFKGYGVHVRVQPRSMEHWTLGVGVYAMDMPSTLVDLNPENQNEGWEVRIDRGYGLFGEYHFLEVNQGWFVGTQASIQDFKVTHTELNESTNYSNWMLMGYGGYVFRPFEHGLYFKPWGGVGVTDLMSGNSRVSDEKYDVLPVSMFATLHIGYTF